MKSFVVRQARRLIVGAAIGCLLSILVHLFFWDSKFLPSFHSSWIKAQSWFDGLGAYKKELRVLLYVLLAALAWFIGARLGRYGRAWWAGITSLTVITTAGMSLFLLTSPTLSFWRVGVPILVIAVGMIAELAIQKRSVHRSHASTTDILNLPRHTNADARALSSQPRGDDPIDDWSEDLIGRSAIVEVLEKYALVQQIPVVALDGALGDGKTSVLNLLRRTLEDRAIVVSFSTWLPGGEASLVITLFRDIATECRQQVYVPQLRKHALAYARTMSSSVSYLAGLKELLPAESQKQEIEDLKQSLARLPLPVVVLLDELDRMNKEELKVLLKILRGAAAIPNTTFICAFSYAEIRRKLVSDELTQEYLEKFFPVIVTLPAPDRPMIGHLFKTRVTNRFSQERSWFSGSVEKQKFETMLAQVWDQCISRVCTNLRKEALLSNDISSTATLVEGEVDPLDLVAIECLKRFYPNVYDLVRRNPAFLVYGSASFKDRYFMRDEKKDADSKNFFQALAKEIELCPDPDGAYELLSYTFPDYDKANKRSTVLSFLRQTDRDSAWQEKRICDPEYFPIYFRAAIPEELFSNRNLERILSELNAAKSEADAGLVITGLLKENPKKHPRRDDALLKISRSVNKLKNTAAERLAFVTASNAHEYAYDDLNIGEAANALNIVFAVAQKLADSSAVQGVLTGAMIRASDDTFALRLLEFTERSDRNKVLTDLTNVDVKGLNDAFISRMRSRYAREIPVEKVSIAQGDWRAFQRWAKNSPEDAAVEQDFWSRFIGQNRKKLAQAINILYPTGYTWSEDPRPIISLLFPVDQLGQMAEDLPADHEQLDEVEKQGIVRLQELLKGKWYDITRRITER